MLSYVIPVEDKPPPVNKNHLQLDLDLEKQLQQQKQQASPKNGTVNGLPSHDNMAPTTIHNIINIEQTHGAYVNGGGTGIKKIIKTHGKVSGPAISTESSASSLSSKASEVSQGGGATPTSAEKLKPKLVQNGGTKTTSLKRVSFGSSKGSMVETLIYESPLQEETETATPTVEITAPFPQEGDPSGADSKKVRVKFFESERPHVVHSPEPDVILDILDAPNVMTSVSPTGIHTPQYQRQASTDSGWDNPFRPDGDLSREADEIVGLIKEGKPITPTSGNGTLKSVDELDAVVATQAKQQLAAASPQKGSNGTANCEKRGVVEVQRTIVSPSSGGEVEPVVIKKKPKCKCCVIQ